MPISRIRSELKVIFGLTALIPIPGLACLGLLEGLLYSGSSHFAGQLNFVVLRDFGFLLPLLSALSVAHLMSVERDEGFDDLRYSYPEPIQFQALMRTVMALVLIAVILGLGWAAYSFASGEMISFQWLLPALPATLFLTGLSLLANHLTGSYWVSAGVSLGYWLVEYQTKGILTHSFFLFNSIWPCEGVDPSINIILILSSGLIFLAANILMDPRRLRFERRQYSLHGE